MKLLTLIWMLAAVESGHDDGAVGDDGAARGRVQIHQAVVDDVNAVLGRRVYTHEDAHDPARAVALARLYLTYWGREYARATGRPPTAEVLARIWVVGPEGWRQPDTLPYWRKVQRAIWEMKRAQGQPAREAGEVLAL